MFRGDRIAIAILFIASLGKPIHAASEIPRPPDGKPIQLADLPARALSAAQSELMAEPSGAKAVSFEGQPAYLVEGTNKYDKHLWVVVASDGRILIPVNIWDADDD